MPVFQKRKGRSVCAGCKRRPRQKPWTLCRRCRSKMFAAVAKVSWKARKRHRELAREAYQMPAPTTRPDLEKLMAEADAAADRALKLALEIKSKAQ